MKRLSHRENLSDVSDEYDEDDRMAQKRYMKDRNYKGGSYPAAKRQQGKQGGKWRIPDSHVGMPQAIRNEVRSFHMLKVYVSEPPKVKLVAKEEASEHEEEVKGVQEVQYCDSTFTKMHDFKVAPPLPTFKVSRTFTLA